MRIKAWYLIVLILFLLLYIHYSRGSVAQSKKQPNAQIFELESNKTYMLGFIEDADIYRMDSGTRHTRIRILPYGMLPMFDRTFDFCGNRAELFRGMGTFVVLVYDKKIHKDNCNDLFGVIQAVGPTLPFEVRVP